MSHYGPEREAEINEQLDKYNRSQKPRIRCLRYKYLIFRNEKKSKMNHAQHQSRNFELACDMALSLA